MFLEVVGNTGFSVGVIKLGAMVLDDLAFLVSGCAGSAGFTRVLLNESSPSEYQFQATLLAEHSILSLALRA